MGVRQLEQVSNAKRFFEVFPTLKVEKDIQELFADVQIKKITTNSSREFLNIHLFSLHLIQKRYIKRMEEHIKKQLFGKTSVAIKIEEDYQLSEQYTPEALMVEYHDSILLELKEVSVLAASMFEQAEIRFEANSIMRLELLNTIVSEGRKEEIVSLLDEIFNQRFHIPTDIRIEYREKEKEDQNLEYDEQRIQREIDAIFARNRKLHGEEREKESGESSSKKKATPVSQKAVVDKKPKDNGNAICCTCSGVSRAITQAK